MFIEFHLVLEQWLKTVLLLTSWSSSLYLDSCFWLFLKEQPGKEHFILKPVFPLEFHLWGEKHFLSHGIELSYMFLIYFP